MVSRRWITTALLVVVVGVGLSACGGGDEEGPKPDLVATKLLRFEPEELGASFNRQVTWSFKNEDDDRQHNFTLPFVFTDPQTKTQNVSVDVGPGQTVDIVFTVTERPREDFLTFYCRFHQAEGMNGRIRLR